MKDLLVVIGALLFLLALAVIIVVSVVQSTGCIFGGGSWVIARPWPICVKP